MNEQVNKVLAVAEEFADQCDMQMAYMAALSEIVRLREMIQAGVEYHGHWTDCAMCEEMMVEYAPKA